MAITSKFRPECEKSYDRAHAPYDTRTQDLEWTLKPTYRRSGRALRAVAAKRIPSKLICELADIAGVFTLGRH